MDLLNLMITPKMLQKKKKKKYNRGDKSLFYLYDTETKKLSSFVHYLAKFL